MIHKILDSNGGHLLSMENYELATSYRGDRINHHYLEISYIKSGKGRYEIDDKSYAVEQGDIFIINNIQKHVLFVEPPAPLINLVIHFEPRFIWSQTDHSFDYRYLQVFFSNARTFTNRLDRSYPVNEKIAKLFLEIEDEFLQAGHGYELMIKVKLLNILVQLSRCVLEPEEKNYAAQFGMSQIDEVLFYIDANLDKPIRLETLAKIAHMNPSYFSTFFKKYNGMNPLKYIRSKRIGKAMEYLKFSGKSITEISSLCGFNNMSSFYSAFKEVTATFPMDYRNK